MAASALREQKKLLANARLSSVATVVQALCAALATLIGLAIVPASILGKAIVFTAALVPLVLALRSRSRATACREMAKAAGERAWQAAAEDVAAHSEGGITGAALAKTLGLEPEHADRLLTALTVHDRTRIDVGDDAEVRYSIATDALAENVRSRSPVLMHEAHGGPSGLSESGDASKSRVSSVEKHRLLDEAETLDDGAPERAARKEPLR